MKNKIMKTFLIIFCCVGLSLLFSCKNQSTVVTGKLPTETNPTELSLLTGNTYVYVKYFTTVNAGAFQTLLENCRRCGTKRFTEGPFGSVTYQKSWTTGENKQRCENWRAGLLQIEFMENKLPTTAKVLIVPKYTGSLNSFSIDGQQDILGEAFEITANVQSINENQGFEIFITPADGINGTYELILRSRNSNHVTSTDLNIEVLYGFPQQIIISDTFRKYQGRWHKETPQFSCNQYTN